jgi:hypothetical protein
LSRTAPCAQTTGHREVFGDSPDRRFALMAVSVGSAAEHVTTRPKTIATVATIDFRAVVVARRNSGGRAPTAAVAIDTYARSGRLWRRLDVLLEDRYWSARALQLGDRDRVWLRRHPSACGCPVVAQPVTWLRRSSNVPDAIIVMGSSFRLSTDRRGSGRKFGMPHPRRSARPLGRERSRRQSGRCGRARGSPRKGAT